MMKHPSSVNLLKMTKVIEDPFDEGESLKTGFPTDLMFRALCSSYGIGSRRSIRIPIVALYVTLAIVFLAIVCAAYGFTPFSNSGRKWSLSDVAIIANIFLITGSLIFFFGRIAIHGDE